MPVPFTVAAGSDLKEVERRALDVVNKATEGMRLENVPTLVKFTGFTPYGITAEVQVYARFDVFPSTAADAAARGAGRRRLSSNSTPAPAQSPRRCASSRSE